jgi:hypothetical protein
MSSRHGRAWLVLGVVLGGSAGAADSGTEQRIASLEAERDGAVARVRQIVNRPVTALPRPADAQVALFQPGWFHPGAIRPDFNTVDVRRTQETPYARFDYVTSDLNPGMMFRGAELEFNAMTKYFYADRSMPKKKLTEAEMTEVNRLYRVIGRSESELLQLRLDPSARATSAPSGRLPIAAVAAAIVSLLLLVVWRRRRHHTTSRR